MAPSTSEDGLTASPSSFEKMSSPGVRGFAGARPFVDRHRPQGRRMEAARRRAAKGGWGGPPAECRFGRQRTHQRALGTTLLETTDAFCQTTYGHPAPHLYGFPACLPSKARREGRRPPGRPPRVPCLPHGIQTHPRALGTKLGRTTDAFCQTARRHPARNPRRRTRRDLDRNAVATLEQFEVRA